MTDKLHTLFEELEPKLKKLTLEEVAKLAGMVLNETCFGVDPQWPAWFVDELDTEHRWEVWMYMNATVFKGKTTRPVED